MQTKSETYWLQDCLEQTKKDRDGTCPVRELLDRIGDTWTLLVVLNLGAGKHRFGELRRNVANISQRMLTQTLRKLERDGLVERTVYPTNPPAVEYELTKLGFSLLNSISSLIQWAVTNQNQIAQARQIFDRRQTEFAEQTSTDAINLKQNESGNYTRRIA